MKKLIIILITLLFSVNLYAEDKTIPIKETPGDIPTDPGKNHHRMPGKQIMCTIDSENGVYIEEIPTSEIISFDIYDESGELCFASFNNEEEFVGFLFSLEGEYVIRFVTIDKTYSGFISL